jgi:hypothetical protein
MSSRHVTRRLAGAAMGRHGSDHEPFIDGGPAPASPFFRKLLESDLATIR